MEGFDFYKILEVLFPILAVVAGAYWLKAKVTLNHLAALITTVNKAVEDDKLTQEEMKSIVDALMKMLGKEVAVK